MEKQTFRLAGTPNGAIRPHEAKLDLLARVADAFWICAALFIACAFYPEAWEVRHSMAAAFGVVLFYMVGQAQGLYRAWRAEPVKSEFSRIWACWAFVIPLLLLVAFMTKTSEAFSRIIIFTWFVLAPALVSVWRVSLRMTLQEARARGYNTRTVARRAERRIVALQDSDGEAVSAISVAYINRLSDFLFVAARWVNEKGRTDILWVPGQNR